MAAMTNDKKMLLSKIDQNEKENLFTLSSKDTNEGSPDIYLIKKENSKLKEQIKNVQEQVTKEKTKSYLIVDKSLLTQNNTVNGDSKIERFLKIHQLKFQKIKDENTRLVKEMQRLQDENFALQNEKSVMEDYKSLLDSYNEIKNIADISEEQETEELSKKNTNSESPTETPNANQEIAPELEMKCIHLRQEKRKEKSAAHENELKSLISSLETRLEQSSQTNQKLQQEITSVQTALKESTVCKNGLSDKINTLQSTIQTLANEKEKVNADLWMLQTKIKKLQDSNSKYKHESKHFRKQLNQMRIAQEDLKMHHKQELLKVTDQKNNELQQVYSKMEAMSKEQTTLFLKKRIKKLNKKHKECEEIKMLREQIQHLKDESESRGNTQKIQWSDNNNMQSKHSQEQSEKCKTQLTDGASKIYCVIDENNKATVQGQNTIKKKHSLNNYDDNEKQQTQNMEDAELMTARENEDRETQERMQLLHDKEKRNSNNEFQPCHNRHKTNSIPLLCNVDDDGNCQNLANVVILQMCNKKLRQRLTEVLFEREKLQKVIVKIQDENEQVVAQLKKEIKDLRTANNKKNCYCCIIL
ncbi:viral A-type inclusion protein [Reticulomyxa filosa]|uniref:Viral A-type inclusion protein n=1 Tax=Reticulomyxa filosa TaxID=46433 RepID=X6MG32_RETFI|nr:viral A-type inclusion protein [Reticulomyxa filosa]|eukprot:ETO12849.1 viral A-type inclusion protein [Reticulomyxa filosa]